MQEKWNSFVYELREARDKNVEEEIYHSQIESQLQLLGWAKWKGEICHKPNIPIGNSKFIQPDILIKDGDEDLFVIEVKRPVHSQTERERVQLESYMRQLKLNVGIYIGEHIEVFYDKPKSKDAVSVLSIPLEIDNKLGAKFVERFSKEVFSKDAIVEFCEARIEEMNRQANLNKIKKGLIDNAQTQITESLMSYLMEKYGDAFSETDIKGMLSQMRFSATMADVPTSPVHKDAPNGMTPLSTDSNTKSRTYDHTGYSLEGGAFLGKNKFVYAVVSTYVRQHPEATFEDIERVFPSELQGSFGVVQTMDYIKSKNFKGRRYFKEPEYVLRSSDGVLFAVSTEWGKGNIEKFLKTVRRLGYNVKLSTSDEEKPAESVKNAVPNITGDNLFYITARGCNARAIFCETDHSMRILKGSLLPQSTAPSYRDREMRNAIIAAMSKPTNDGFWELQQDYVLKSPSTAASYCAGRSCNGWDEWVNDAGLSLDELYRSE